MTKTLQFLDKVLFDLYQKTTAEELLGKELPLMFAEVDEEQDMLVLSNRKAMVDSQAQLGGSVVLGTVESLKPYGAFIERNQWSSPCQSD